MRQGTGGAGDSASHRQQRTPRRRRAARSPRLLQGQRAPPCLQAALGRSPQVPAPSAAQKPAREGPPPALGPPPSTLGPSRSLAGGRALPVAHPPGEVQAGLLQVGLEVGEEEIPPALGADVGGAVFVHPLVGVEAAAVGHDHGARRADLRDKGRELQPGTHRAGRDFSALSLCCCGKESVGSRQLVRRALLGDDLLVAARWVTAERVPRAQMPFPGFSSQMDPSCTVLRAAWHQPLCQEGAGAHSNQLPNPFHSHLHTRAQPRGC